MEKYTYELLKKYLRNENIMINPYKPGAGTEPEYLAGRDKILKNASYLLNELKNGGMAEHTIYYGVRGVGKTVLLNKIGDMASNMGYLCAHIECDGNTNIIKAIVTYCRSFLKKLSLHEYIKDVMDKALAMLKSFKATYMPEDQSFSIELKDEIMTRYGNADTGDLTTDLISLFSSLGELALGTGTPICFIVDEIQSMNKNDLMSIIAVFHRMNQLSMPFLLIGAGLPTIKRIASDAKSYAERMFMFVKVTSLNRNDAVSALIEPAKQYDVHFTEDSVNYILDETGCYPYFIQQYGKLIWKILPDDRIFRIEDAEFAKSEYRDILDDSFFGTRYNRATNKEKEFLHAMTMCCTNPCSMTDVASKMKKNVKSISPLRSHLLNKGLIYSPSYGEVDFTVPHFEKFLRSIKTDQSHNMTEK